MNYEIFGWLAKPGIDPKSVVMVEELIMTDYLPLTPYLRRFLRYIAILKSPKGLK